MPASTPCGCSPDMGATSRRTIAKACEARQHRPPVQEPLYFRRHDGCRTAFHPPQSPIIGARTLAPIRCVEAGTTPSGIGSSHPVDVPWQAWEALPGGSAYLDRRYLDAMAGHQKVKCCIGMIKAPDGPLAGWHPHASGTIRIAVSSRTHGRLHRRAHRHGHHAARRPALSAFKHPGGGTEAWAAESTPYLWREESASILAGQMDGASLRHLREEMGDPRLDGQRLWARTRRTHRSALERVGPGHL